MKKQIIQIEPYGEVQVTTSPRARSIRLSISNGQLRVTKPSGTPLVAVKAMIRNNYEWIDARLHSSREVSLIHDGDIVGPDLKVHFSNTSTNGVVVKSKNGIINILYPATSKQSDNDVQGALREELFKKWRTLAKQYIPERLEYLAKRHGFSYKELRLKKIRSRWGSCSSKNNININIQLMKLDEELIDHVLLHELSHTKALNHGPDFWSIFESVRPNARTERKQLKQMTIF